MDLFTVSGIGTAISALPYIVHRVWMHNLVRQRYNARCMSFDYIYRSEQNGANVELLKSRLIEPSALEVIKREKSHQVAIGIVVISLLTQVYYIMNYPGTFWNAVLLLATIALAVLNSKAIYITRYQVYNLYDHYRNDKAHNSLKRLSRLILGTPVYISSTDHTYHAHKDKIHESQAPTKL